MGTDEFDDPIDVVRCNDQAFQDMSLAFRFRQQVEGSATNHFATMVPVCAQELEQTECPGPTPDQCDLLNPEGGL